MTGIVEYIYIYVILKFSFGFLQHSSHYISNEPFLCDVGPNHTMSLLSNIFYRASALQQYNPRKDFTGIAVGLGMFFTVSPWGWLVDGTVYFLAKRNRISPVKTFSLRDLCEWSPSQNCVSLDHDVARINLDRYSLFSFYPCDVNLSLFMSFTHIKLLVFCSFTFHFGNISSFQLALQRLYIDHIDQRLAMHAKKEIGFADQHNDGVSNLVWKGK